MDRESFNKVLAKIWADDAPRPDYIIGVFDGKLGQSTSLEGWEPVGVNPAGMPVFRRKPIFPASP